MEISRETLELAQEARDAIVEFLDSFILDMKLAYVDEDD